VKHKNSTKIMSATYLSMNAEICGRHYFCIGRASDHRNAKHCWAVLVLRKSMFLTNKSVTFQEKAVS